MKKSHLILLPALLVIAAAAVACTAGKNNREEMTEGRGRRQVLSDKKDVEDTYQTPAPSESPYLMRLENKTLTLYEIKDGEENALRAVNIDPSYYPPEDIKELTQGIIAYSKEEGFARMENFTN